MCACGNYSVAYCQLIRFALQDKGFLPSGLVNFVALLGWNPAGGNNQEIFDMKELEQNVRFPSSDFSLIGPIGADQFCLLVFD